jgi:hypothetical protein
MCFWYALPLWRLLLVSCLHTWHSLSKGILQVQSKQSQDAYFWYAIINSTNVMLIVQCCYTDMRLMLEFIQVFTLILVCPFKILYRSSRYQFLRAIRNIILTPFYKVFWYRWRAFFQMSEVISNSILKKNCSIHMFICRLSWSISSWLISFVAR